MWWSIRGPFKRAAAAVAVLLVALGAAGKSVREGEPPDYEKIFGRSYRQALDFVRKNRRADSEFRARSLDPAFAWAVVFPELIRWSALSDVIETSNLRVLYVQFGKGYTDFSVGHFQMKPSFVETLEGDYNRLIDPEEKAGAGIPAFDAADTVENRRTRVSRMTGLDGQVRYLIAFLLVMDKVYAGESWLGAEEKLRFTATAYNAGYRRGAAALKRESSLLRFHTGVLVSRPAYSYAGIALDFFRKFPLI